VVSSLVQVGSVSAGQVGTIVFEAVAFLGGSIVIGRLVARRLAPLLARLDSGHSMLFALVLASGLFFAWMAHAIGLAPIIGAFAAGLLFEPIYLARFERPAVVREIEPLLPGTNPSEQTDRMRSVLHRHTQHQHEHMVEPIGYFFVPVFFVLTGMQVDLRTLADPAVIAVALGVTVAAVLGKIVAGIAAGRAGNPWVVGWGMVPRGEVGLIFAMVAS
jgi:Kef-type K+ transport system membrane component KefB